MSAAILFVALLAGSSSGLKTHQQPFSEPVFSFVPDNGLMCFQGPDDDAMSSATTAFYGGPLHTFSPSTEIQAKSCAELGYPQLVNKEDDCWFYASLYMKDGADVKETLASVRAQNVHAINAFADSHGFQRELAKRWAACYGGCFDKNAVAGKGNITKEQRWWGVDYSINFPSCMLINTGLNSIIQESHPDTVMFLADNGYVCWEGELDYMTKTLEDAKRGPAADMLQNAEVMEGKCTEVGYEWLAESRDSCWPEARMLANYQTYQDDLFSFMLADSGIFSMMNKSDVRNGWASGTSIDLGSCLCQKGGKNRDRGQLYTMSNPEFALRKGASSTRYSDEFCAKLIKQCGI
jgi:hypothetical protein